MIFESPLGDVAVPDVTLPAFVLEDADERGDRPALIDGPTGRTLTYGDLARAVRSLAAGLADRGFGRGDVLALCAPNGPEYAVAFHAVAALGGVVTTINPAYTAHEIGFQLENADARLAVAAAGFEERVREAGAQDVLVMGEPSFDDLLTGGDAPMPDEADPDDLVALPYSSGTTGLPKGVMLTHRNVVANLCQVREVQHVGEGDTIIGVLPFFHIYGMTVIMNQALRTGATIVTMPRFDLAGFLELVERHGVTKAHLVPPIILALAKHPLVDEHDVSTLAWINSGAAPLGAELADACARRLGLHRRPGLRPDRDEPGHPRRPGRARREPARLDRPADPGHGVPGRRRRVGRGPRPGRGRRGVDPRPAGDARLPRRRAVDGRHARRATAGCTPATSATPTRTAGSTSSTASRSSSRSRASRSRPPSSRPSCSTHPEIADAAVIASPDEEAGEVPKAFVVPADGATLDVEAIKAYVAERVASYKQVRRVELTDEIPKSASGKVLRRVLVERERAGAS